MIENGMFLKKCKDTRKLIGEMSAKTGSGHVGSCFSCVEILHSLFDYMNDVDRFILSKGHAAMALYSIFVEKQIVCREELLSSYLADGGKFWGHPTHKDLTEITLSTGSLGHGPCVACGIAYGDYLDGTDKKIYVLLSDGECQEGSVWEAASFASKNKLKNIVFIVDNNGLQAFNREETDREGVILKGKWESFGIITITCDGHNQLDLLNSYKQANDTNSPVVIIANTVKGKGWEKYEGKIESHYDVFNGGLI